jgi:hypothetical protein
MIYKKKIFFLYSALGAALVVCSLGLSIYHSIPPRLYTLSPSDEVASQSLSAYLNTNGATDRRSVCWLGDPNKIFLNRFLGSFESPWDRLREKRRVVPWSSKQSCLNNNFHAIVVFFPLLLDIYSLPQDESALLQREASEVLSQSGRASNRVRHPVSFRFVGGGNLLVFTYSDAGTTFSGSDNAQKAHQ